MAERTDYLVKALNDLLDKEQNPVMRFSLEAFSKNYQDGIMRHVLDGSFEIAVCKADEADLNQLFSDIMLQAMTVSSVSYDLSVVKVAKKNAELMESQNNKAAMRYMKIQLESSFLVKLIGKKLEKYLESLDQNVAMIHLPCANPNCNNVILVSKFLDLVDLLSMTAGLTCGKCNYDLSAFGH
jgi:hypothetical protein